VISCTVLLMLEVKDSAFACLVSTYAPFDIGLFEGSRLSFVGTGSSADIRMALLTASGCSIGGALRFWPINYFGSFILRAGNFSSSRFWMLLVTLSAWEENES